MKVQLKDVRPNDASIEQEIVRAVVLAYGAGKIELEKPERLHEWRDAPGFVADWTAKRTLSSRPYTASTIASFLGWEGPGKLAKVRTALEALEQQEKGLHIEELRGIASKLNSFADKLERVHTTK